MIIYTSGLYIWYRFAMWLLSRRHQIREKNTVLYYVSLVLAGIGIACDVLYNIFIGSIIFLQVPRLFSGEFTLSQRLKRIHKEETYRWSWRSEMACYICEHILNKYDPSGKHC